MKPTYEQGDVVRFNMNGSNLLNVERDIHMVVDGPSTIKDCYECHLLNTSDGDKLKNNYHFSSYDPENFSLTIHVDFIQLVSEYVPRFDTEAFNDLLSTV